ncbi:DUF6520 family protein [Flagellimonas oceanensis]|uniref:DUF6520 family protein n=1 Tax=Flagellimonas oceanensis TaxID=2499163 RepID=UPI000F8C45B9|nr:DUF6520 family protein [Allomuricauda oceanensis]|tara:strand:+ start:560 stop:811 length:252 start_codon:yes stop_codon:yes gene_type:complete
MKSNFLKLVLPAFAILLAVGLAFATEAPSADADRVAYYKPLNEPWQTIMVEEACFQGGNENCEYLGYQLYESDDITSTQLSKP